MPDEPKNDEQQPESTPHFDTFSGRSNDIKPPLSNSNHTFGPVVNSTQISPEPIIEPQINQQPQAFGSTDTPIIASTPEETTGSQPLVETNNSKLPKWLKNKKLVIGIILAIVIVLVAGGSAFAYVSYYQNPQKVISDSIVNAFTSKTSIYTGTLNVDSSDLKVGVNITSKLDGAAGSLDADLTVTTSDKTYKISGSGLVDKSGDLYFKVDHLAGIIAEAKTSLGIALTSSASTAIDKLVAKIDGTWIKVSSNDLKQYSEDAATSKTCINDTVKKFKDDKSAVGEITDLYTKNPFIVVDKDLGQVNGSFGYQIKGSNAKLKVFLDGLKNTKIYKSLHDCDKTFVIDTSTMSTKDETDKNNTIKLWVDVWSHQITKVELNGKDSGTTTSATILPKFNQSVAITAPAKSITLTQLQSYIQDLFSSMYGSQL